MNANRNATRVSVLNAASHDEREQSAASDSAEPTINDNLPFQTIPWTQITALLQTIEESVSRKVFALDVEYDTAAITNGFVKQGKVALLQIGFKASRSFSFAAESIQKFTAAQITRDFLD